MKKSTTIFSAVALSLSMAAANAEDQAVAATIGQTAGAVGSGFADAGRGLVNAPVKLFKMGDDSLPDLSVGVNEFGVSGALNWADDVIYNMDLTYGYFFRENWEIGFKASVSGVESDASYGLGLFTEYNFACESKWVPFVGFSAGWQKLNGNLFDSDAIALGLDLGIKYFINKNVAISLSVGADYAFEDVFPGGDDFAKTLNLGTRFYF